MHILIVSQYFWPENFRVNDLVVALEARGHEVSILTGQPNYPDGAVFPEFRNNPESFSKYGQAQIHRVPIIPRGKGSAMLVLNYLSFCIIGSVMGPWKLRKVTFDAIFVFQTSPITAAIPAIVLRAMRKRPMLMWVLDLWPDTLVSLGVVKSRIVLDLVDRMVGFIYARCDRILVQSRAFDSSIARYANSKSRIRYFPGWPEQVFTGLKNGHPPAPELEQFAKKFVVLFAGNIGESQDFPSIIEAAHLLRDRDEVIFAIVGDGRAASLMQELVRQRQIEHKIVFLGRYPIERMPSFFNAAQALLVSLRDEGSYRLTIPGKIQSYLSAGKPILGMLNGEGARVIEDAGAGICCPAGDGKALAKSIEGLMEMPLEVRMAMAESGKAYCDIHFNRDTLVGSLEKWIGEVAKTNADSEIAQ